MEIEAPSGPNVTLCQICTENQSLYVCPKCTINYCSLKCYQSEAHLECSETFYKNCVEEELQSQQCDAELKQKTVDMLQRIYNEDCSLNDFLEGEGDESDYEADLDSDDENLPSLEKRLENVNLNDANELWSALTTSEKQEFEALIHSGEASKLLPAWNPWWAYHSKKPLVEDLSNKEIPQSYIGNCPSILDVPAWESVSKASPFLRFNIINTLYAYAFDVLYFNGEHHTAPLDAMYIFLHTCETMKIDRIFKNSSSAVESVLLAITNCESFSGDQETIMGTKAAGDAILNGPDAENKSFYCLSALSDLHQLINEAKIELTTKLQKPLSDEFKNKFQTHIDLGSFQITRKNLSLYMKKIEFYVGWLKCKGQMYDITEGDTI
ncbi:hypothetical protein TKK_0014921 [Trichogramma kaykai]|uniref:HIT-type domain-containing protein n=1 Tax=Trichogramma kaykai TaxID=54128 RepID=A0ABD2WCQ5_9HYME